LLHQGYDRSRSAASGWGVSWSSRKRGFGCGIGSDDCELLSELLTPRVVAILRELIIEAEKRLELIDQANAKSPGCHE
jgi:hypothetical protein